MGVAIVIAGGGPGIAAACAQVGKNYASKPVTNPVSNRPVFAITGMPRSRTAWLSCLFTCSSVECFHDLIGVQSLPDVFRVLDESTAKVVGLSDCGYGFIFPETRQRYKAVREIIIERDPAKCFDSMCRVLSDLPQEPVAGAVTAIQERIDRMPERGRTLLRVPYESLDDIATLERMWNFAVPEVAFPVRHAEKLLTMRVTVHDERLRKLARVHSILA